MLRLEDIQTPTQAEVLVAFTGLAGFNKRYVLPGEDRPVFDAVHSYFTWAGGLIQQRGGTVIKCMGDAMLLAFPADSAGPAVMALLELKAQGDAWLAGRNIPCHHQIKAHLGPVIAGPVGAPGQERLDILGKTVNICATLANGPLPVVLTPQVFRALDAGTRKHFKKHTPPVTYIRVEDRH
jgi:class 3 adenylate cyclase